MSNIVFTKEPAGAIGITPAGKYLDRYLTEYAPSYGNKLIHFITEFTRRVKQIRAAIQHLETKDGEYILNLCRKDYNNILQKRFMDIDSLPFDLTRNYINTLTKIDFVSSNVGQGEN